VFVEDCTGCEACVYVCPAKDKKDPSRKSLNMVRPAAAAPRRASGPTPEYFLGLPDADRTKVKQESVKGSQLLQPLFEFSGACAGCGETPYVKLLTQLFRPTGRSSPTRTGCSSIYGGNLPTTPYPPTRRPRPVAGPTRCSRTTRVSGTASACRSTSSRSSPATADPERGPQGQGQLVDAIRSAKQVTEKEIYRAARARGRAQEAPRGRPGRRQQAADAPRRLLVKKSVWIVGGDGWAYDIGYGGLDHILAQGRNVNVLVLDTEVYSNTGGQMSKSTPMGAVAKFAAGGKPMPKKDLGLIAMSYGHIYVATVAMGASDLQTVRAFMEAEAYDGPSIILPTRTASPTAST
jgi:pyruvate-ferredoxin/flavodoxin oxidoreductase